MGKRKGSHGAGSWSFPGGWMRHGEDFQDTCVREVKEETGIDITGRARFFHVSTTLFKESDVQSVTVLFFVYPEEWEGEPKAMEPEKLDGEWKWFHHEELPSPLFEPLQGIRLARKIWGQERIVPR